MKIMFSAVLLSLTVFICGCRSDDNNYLRPEDFASYLERSNVKVVSVRPLPGAPFKATSGAGLMIEGSEIGVYKFDRTSKAQTARITRIKQSGRVYINGIPYPVKIFGSFMFMGLEKNTRKRDILRVIHQFR